MNKLLLDALACKSVERPPVWIMRQAGRYLPEYRKLREKHSLWTLFHEPELAVQVTLQPLARFPLDAAILFSDILVLAEVLGLSVVFPERGGPRVEPQLRPHQKLNVLPIQSTLHYVFETISELKKQLKVPLLGFSGAPFTLACYFIDSTSKNLFCHTKEWMAEDPKGFHELLALLTSVVTEYLLEQVKAGVDAVQLFDSWANMLSDEEFMEFCFPYLKQIIESVQQAGTPVIFFSRGSALRAELLVGLGAQCLSFDWQRPIEELRAIVPKEMAVQGNFAPELLKASPEEISKEVDRAKRAMKLTRGWIANLGHGITPDIPVDNVAHFLECVRG